MGDATESVIRWFGERGRDLVRWPVRVVSDFPARLVRLLGTIVGWGRAPARRGSAMTGDARGSGAKGVGRRLLAGVRSAGLWLLALVGRVIDLVGGPELLEAVLRATTRTSPLTDAEIAAGRDVLGPDGLRWSEVRVASGGLLNPIFRLNKHRAFTAFHTINVPDSGRHTRTNIHIIVHEFVHVLQYECVGSVYIAQALHAQATVGYQYGGPGRLRHEREAGKRLRDYNREQQAQIAQDFYALYELGRDTRAYEPLISEMRARQF
jgi:hypothetical protein